MLKLYKPSAPRWVQLPAGAALLCSPVSTPLAYAARARADALLVELQSAGEAVTKAGGHIVDVPDLSTPEGLAGTRQSLFVVSLAELAATDWRGVGDDDGTPLKFDAGHMAGLMAHPGVADTFQADYLSPVYSVISEGNV
jgi:hypothetical protein